MNKIKKFAPRLGAFFCVPDSDQPRQIVPFRGVFAFLRGVFAFLAVFTFAFCGISKGKKHAAEYREIYNNCVELTASAICNAYYELLYNYVGFQ